MDNDNYSWMREAVAEEDHDGERFSELIADTVGGRTRAQLAEHQKQVQQDHSHDCISAVSSNGDGFSAFTRRIEQHPQPGDGARRLLQMVQQPFSVRFGSIEQQRAGSSTRPPLTPFLKDAEPEIFHDSPRVIPVTRKVGTQTQPTPPLTSRRTHSLSDYPPLYDFSQRPSSHSPRVVPVPRAIGTQTQPTPPVASRRAHSLSDYPPLYSRRTHSLSDYPPLYDFSQHPDPNFYRRRFINSLLNKIRRSKDLERTLDDRRKELDEACRRDAFELGTIRRERELLVHELEMQSREYNLANQERHRSNSVAAQPAPKQQRVNFASPICTAKEYTPNNSSRVRKLPSHNKNAKKSSSESGACDISRMPPLHRNASTGVLENPSSIFKFVPPPRR